jgi:hypothetical protein
LLADGGSWRLPSGYERRLTRMQPVDYINETETQQGIDRKIFLNVYDSYEGL